MTGAELDDHTMDALEPLSKAPMLGVLLGAGASIGAGLPSWDGLATALLTGSGVIEDEDTAKRFLAKQDPQLAAEAAKAASGDWDALLLQALYGAELDRPKPTPLHLASAGLAISRASEGYSTELLTLNFDGLIEDAYRALDGDAEIFSRTANGPRAAAGEVEVHHLHGMVPFDQPARDVILTLADFNALGGQRSPWQMSALQAVLQRGSLVLAGTSYRDPDIRQWLHDIREADPSQTNGQVYVLLSRASLELSRSEFEVTRDALVAQWNGIGVGVVVMQDHADAAQALQEIGWRATHSSSAYVAPRQRARRVWAAHAARFESLQASYAEQLARHLDQVRARLGPRANLTLWLSDGEGRIARWASPDRIYRGPDLLLRVRPGFDSRWIAGQCLASDETMARPVPVDATRRWRSVVASPVIASVDGGPPCAVGVLTSATDSDLDAFSSDEQDAWSGEMDEIAGLWGERLSAVSQS